MSACSPIDPCKSSNSKGISFTGNDVSRGSIGLTLDNVTDSLIDANLFHELNEDGIRPLDTDNVDYQPQRVHRFPG